MTQPGVPPDGPDRPRPILIVEDEPDTRYVLSSVLRDEGYQVEMAADGAQAVLAASAVRPVLVLLDWMLPDQDGEQVARAIRSQDPTAQFVVVTADGRAEEKAERVQASGHLQKPFLLDELLATVARVLGGVGGTPL